MIIIILLIIVITHEYDHINITAQYHAQACSDVATDSNNHNDSNSTLMVQVKAAIKRGSNAKRTIAAFFFALSGIFIRARRVKNGVDLKWAVQPRPFTALLRALLTVALLAPFHR